MPDFGMRGWLVHDSGNQWIERLRVTSASRGRIGQQLTDTEGGGGLSNIDLILVGSVALINVDTLS